MNPIGFKLICIGLVGGEREGQGEKVLSEIKKGRNQSSFRLISIPNTITTKTVNCHMSH